MWNRKDEKLDDAAKAEPAAAEAPEAAEKKRADEYYDQLLRLKAEFENYRKRTDRERGELIRSGRDELLLKLLPVYDILLAAHQQLAAKPEGGELAKGVEMVYKELHKVLAAEGVAVIEAAGKPYDHSQHEVLGTVERADLPEETVVDELQRGFTLQGRLLRPARVRISKAGGLVAPGSAGTEGLPPGQAPESQISDSDAKPS